MKIAITASGLTLNDPVDNRFGRAAQFLVYDLDNDSFTIVSNAQNLQAAQGAGVQAAQNVASLGVHALITGNCGPKAFSVLKAAGIKIYNTSASSIQDAINQYKNGELPEANSANTSSHWL